MDSAPTSRSTRRFIPSHFLLLVVLVLYAAVASVVVTDLNIYTPDSTRYLVWAKSLATFQGFIDRTLPDPVRYVVHAPLYPFLLLPATWLSTHGILAAKLTTVIFGILALACCYAWLRPRAGSSLALTATILLALHPMFLLFSTEVLSDVPFAACVMAVFIFSANMAADDRVPLRSLLVLSLLLAAGMLLREIGFTLVAAAALFFLAHRKWKETLLVTVIPVVTYALWFVRNEIIVAHNELPAMTNARLMTAHFFTLPDAGIVQEWLARATANAQIYGALAAKLIFLPLHGWVQFDVVYVARSPLAEAWEFLNVAAYPLMAVTCAGVLWGCVVDFRSSATALLRGLFVLAYCLAILFYPVNDIRFMLPVLVMMLYYFFLGLSSIPAVRARRWGVPAMCALLLLMSVPGFLWDAGYAGNCAAYNSSPIAFFEATRGLKKYPSHFTKPFSLVGAWFVRETSPDALVLTQWKDLANWTDGRKVYPVDQTVPLDDFESIIRDYGVTHLVAVVQKNGAREFDMQMHATMRYTFSLKSAIANVEVYEIARKSPPSRSLDASTPYRHGITLLLTGSYAQAGELLATARAGDSLNMPVRFAAAVADEFAMNLERAKSEFAALAAMPQSLMYAGEANLHRQMIERLAVAEATRAPADEADGYLRAARIAWNLGYRVKARELVGRSFSADSTFFPAMIFGVHFAIAEGDTLDARRLMGKAMAGDSANPATLGFGRIFSRLDSLRSGHGSAARSRLYMGISTAYRDLGISDAAIDNAFLAWTEDSTNADAAMALAGMYELKRRWSPAKSVLARAVLLHPDAAVFRERLRAVEGHF